MRPFWNAMRATTRSHVRPTGALLRTQTARVSPQAVRRPSLLIHLDRARSLHVSTLARANEQKTNRLISEQSPYLLVRRTGLSCNMF